MNSAGESRFSAEVFLLASEDARQESVTEESAPPSPGRYRRLAIWLAVATIVSTFWAGASAWVPTIPLFDSYALESLLPVRRTLLANWMGGLQFSLALMAILVAHELGHYFLTILYRVPSTPPLFIPFPFLSPIGTMGAVIMMQSGTADRRQIFDIGLAGPLAGLVVAVPVIIFGILNNTPIRYAPNEAIIMGQPLLIQWLGGWLMPEQASEFVSISNSQANPLLMAGWVGLLVTGLNMMPLGQLDGGHVAFGLLGKRSYWVAVAALTATLGYMLYSEVYIFSLMIFLVLLMGLRHPPSSNDDRELGVGRQIVGWISLALPILCIPANPLVAVQ